MYLHLRLSKCDTCKNHCNTSVFWIHLFLKTTQECTTRIRFSEIPPKNEDPLQEFCGPPSKNIGKPVFSRKNIIHKIFIKLAQAQDSQESPWTKCRIAQAQDSQNPTIFWNYQARAWQSSKKSWACAWILHFVHRDSWESWAWAGFVLFSHFKIKIFTSKSRRT